MPAYGVSKAAFVKKLARRLFWTTLLLVSLFAFSYHFCLLVCRFLDSPVSTKISLDAVNFHFPSMEICSSFLTSVSKGNLEQDMDGTYKHLLPLRSKVSWDSVNLLRKKLNNSHAKKLSEIFMQKLPQTILLSTFAQDQIIGANEKYQTIIRAYINDEEVDLRAFEPIPHNKHYACFRFKNNSRLKSHEDKLILYLYNGDSQIANFASSDEVNALRATDTKHIGDNGSSLILIFSQEGKYPSHESFQLMASAGMQTTIRVSSIAYSMINNDKYPCRDNLKEVEIVSHLDNSRIFTYALDYRLCESYNWALEFHRKCRCIPLYYPMPADIFNKTGRCMNVTRWPLDEIVKNIECTENLKQNTQTKDKIQRLCKAAVPCQKLTYNAQWSSVIWPTRSSIQNFIDNIMEPAYKLRKKNNYSVLAWENLLHANSSEIEAMMHENIVKVEIRPKQKRSTLIHDSLTYSATDLFADICGIFGFYLGICIFLVFEILQTFDSVVHLRKSLSVITKSYIDNEYSVFKVIETI